VQATEDLEWVGYTLGSQRIKELVYQKAKLGRWRDLTEMLRAAAEEPTLGKMTGDLLEQYGHDMCQQGIALDPEDVKEVSKGTVGRPRTETEAEERQREQAIKEIRDAFGGSKEKKYDASSEGIDLAKLVRTYVKPLVKVQESWDSLVCSGDGWVNAVQFTRNVQHRTSAEGMRKLVERASASGVKVRLVHVVPTERFDEYGWQSWSKGSKVLRDEEVPAVLKSVKQWVVRLKLPSAGSCTSLPLVLVPE
jgi:hypothetical protein